MAKITRLSSPVITTKPKHEEIGFFFVIEKDNGDRALVGLVYHCKKRTFRQSARNNLHGIGEIDFTKSFRSIPLHNTNEKSVIAAMRSRLTDEDLAFAVKASFLHR
jgi:hypothetical protein